MTALITRRSAFGAEVVVFDHPLAGVQLPAGTTLPDETPAAGVLREGWEETGIPHLRIVDVLDEVVEATPGCGHGRLVVDSVVGGVPFTRGHAAEVLDARDNEVLVQVVDHQGWIPLDAYCDDVVRHIVELESSAATPAEWWVVTPDGGGLCWRCRWAPADGDAGLVPAQAPWLAGGRERLAARTPSREFRFPGHPLRNETTHLQFWAFPGVEKRFVVSWVDGSADVDDSLVRRALALCRTDAGSVVLVSGDGRTMWNFPGGGREPGESIAATVAREVSEEACAEVIDLDLIGYQHVLHLDDDDNVVDEELQARFVADVRLGRWEPRFGIGGRRLVPMADVRPTIGCWWQPTMLEAILRAAERS